MVCATLMNNIIEERYELCICLYMIAKDTDKKNHEKRKRGLKNMVYRHSREQIVLRESEYRSLEDLIYKNDIKLFLY